MAKVSNVVLKVQSGTDRTMYTSFKWTKTNTDSYTVQWQYYTKNNKWFEGSTSSVTTKQSTYSAPSNATQVRVRIKPVAKTHNVDNKEVAYWKADWSSWKTFKFVISSPVKAGVPYNVNVDEQTDSNNLLYATWDWKQNNVDYYQTIWQYTTGDGVWFNGSDSTTTSKQSTYSLPDNATKIRFKVKPFSKTKTVYGVETKYWTADWSSWVTHSAKEFLDPEDANTPTIEYDKTKITAEVESDCQVTNYIQFQLVKDDKSVVTTNLAQVKTGVAKTAFTSKLSNGSEYKVRCRGLKITLKKGVLSVGNALDGLTSIPSKYADVVYGEWSDYTDNIYTPPAVISRITLHPQTETEVLVKWSSVKSASSYEVEYTKQQKYFDSGTSEVTTKTVSSVVCHADITGLETATTWYFRVRAVNDQGGGEWSPVEKITIGKAPSAPTTWSESTTVIMGNPIRMYWTHNSEDGSNEHAGEIQIWINGVDKGIIRITKTDDEIEEGANSVFILVTDTGSITTGSKVKWRVRTRGVLDKYGDWSTIRSIDVYEQPSIVWDKEIPELLDTFPMTLSATSSAGTQTPTGYYLSMVTNESYETQLSNGQNGIVAAGQEVYSQNLSSTSYNYSLEITPYLVHLQNNISYTITLTVYMNSGLNASVTSSFVTGWEESDMAPDAEIGFDESTLTAFIRPTCLDADGNEIENVRMDVYRREYDGQFTLIAENIDNTQNIYVTDPHPALDSAKYRVIAKSLTTGTMEFYDVPNYVINNENVVIQWDEQWQTLQGSEETQDTSSWAGSMIKIPYNISVSENSDIDVALIEYIGRRYPVTYYGTQLGQSGSWSVEIPKTDVELLFALRRLQIYLGDVYVREPSGSGYWANIKVSFSQSYDKMTIPVTLDVRRVEGGV